MPDDSGLLHLFAAYTAIWIVLLGYVARLRHRQRDLWRTVRRLEERLGETP